MLSSLQYSSVGLHVLTKSSLSLPKLAMSSSRLPSSTRLLRTGATISRLQYSSQVRSLIGSAISSHADRRLQFHCCSTLASTSGAQIYSVKSNVSGSWGIFSRLLSANVLVSLQSGCSGQGSFSSRLDCFHIRRNARRQPTERVRLLTPFYCKRRITDNRSSRFGFGYWRDPGPWAGSDASSQLRSFVNAVAVAGFCMGGPEYISSMLISTVRV